MTRSILLVGVARAVSLFLGVLLLGVLGRRLGPGGFGTLQLALAVMIYPLLFVDLGLTTLGLREIAKGNPSIAVIRGVLGARLMLAAGVVTFVAAAILLLPLDTESRLVLVILTVGVPGAALNSRWVLQGERRFGRAATVEVLASGTQLLAAVTLVQGTGDVAWAATALTIGTWVATTMSVLFAGLGRDHWPRIDRTLPAALARSLPLGAAAIAITVYYSIDTVLLGAFRSAEEVAYYSAAYRIILPILALAGAVGTVAIPHFAHQSTMEIAGANQAAMKLCRRMVLLALPIAAGGAIAAEPIIWGVYGLEFAPAAGPFRILIWSVVTVYANAAFAFLLLARQGDRRYLAAAAVGATLNMGLNLVVIPLAGMVGAAMTTIVSEVAVLGLILWWTRDVSVTAVVAAVRVAVVPTVGMAVVVWPLRDSILAVPVGALGFGLVALVSGAIPLSTLRGHLKRAGG